MAIEAEPRPAQAEHNQAELDRLGNERLKELAEKSAEQSPDTKTERAEQAREVLAKQERTPEPPPAGDREKPNSDASAGLDRILNYRQTLASVQRRLRPASRNFSKVIHNTTVESTSEALEKTVMRPSVTLGATWTALIVGLIFYLTARHYGYHLSGFEMIGALIVGAVLGIVIEGLTRLVRTKR